MAKVTASVPESPSVISGRSGYLFLAKDRNNTIGQISGQVLLDAREVRAWRYVFETRTAWMQKRGIPYVYMAAPFKEVVYADLLPDDIRLSSNRPILQIRREVGETVPFVYAVPELIAGRDVRATYSPGDTHWNDFGAYVAYRQLMAEVARHLPISELSPDRVKFREIAGEGDLAGKIGGEDRLTVAEIVGATAFVVENNRISNIGGQLVLHNPRAPNRTCLIFRDSFSVNLLQFLGETFGRVVAVWQPNVDYTLVERERPHVVISQQAERFMVVVPDDLYGMSQEEYAAAKRAATHNGVLEITPQVQAIHDTIVRPRREQDSLRRGDIRTPQMRHIDRWTRQHADQKVLACKREYRVVVVGDSLARGWRDKRLADHFGAVLNLGISGDRIANILWRFADTEVNARKGAVFTVVCGVNNVRFCESAIETAAGVEDLVGLIRERFAAARIIVATLPAYDLDSTAAHEMLLAFNVAVRDLARRYGLDLLDFEQIFASAGIPMENLLLEDRLHISEEGYRLMTNALLAAVK